MDQDDLKYLDDNAQQLYMAYQRRFESDDWKELIAWAENEATKCSVRQLMAVNWEAVLTCRGERKAYDGIIGLEVATENEFKAMVEDAKSLLIAEVESEYE